MPRYPTLVGMKKMMEVPYSKLSLSSIIMSESAPSPSPLVADSGQPADTQSAANSDSDGRDCFNKVQTVLSTYLTSSPLYELLLSTLSLSSASSGHVTLKLIVLPVHVNSKAGELFSTSFPCRVVKLTLRQQSFTAPSPPHLLILSEG